MRNKGKVTTWNDEKGFGFITPFAGGKQVFIHVKAFGNRDRRPQVNDVVTFALSSDQQGRPCAADATLAGDRLKPRAAKQRNTPAILVASFFLGAVGVSVMAGRLPVLIGVVYAALSPIAYYAYAQDKSAARSGAGRTAENTLHLLSLGGGWPGALIAQQTLRHKTRKASFRAMFWATVFVNCGAVLWLQTEDGKAVLASFLA